MKIEEPGGPNAVTLDPDHPVFQVDIFTRLTEPAHLPEEERTFLRSEWKIHDSDVVAVLAWAAEKADGRPYTVQVAAPDDDDTLIWLFGEDPTRAYLDGGVFELSADGAPDDF